MVGSEPRGFGFRIAKPRLRREAQGIIDQYGFPLRAGQRGRELGFAQRQMVEVLKAGLRPNLSYSTAFQIFAGVKLSFGQVPARPPVDHQHAPFLVFHHAPRSVNRLVQFMQFFE